MRHLETVENKLFRYRNGREEALNEISANANRLVQRVYVNEARRQEEQQNAESTRLEKFFASMQKRNKSI